MNSDIIEANRRVHSSLILSGEYQKSPHRRTESIQRLQSQLARLPNASGSLLHLDVGCGDGFVFECKPTSWISHGLDATPEMLAACAKNHPNVKLQEGIAEHLPFPDASFDVVTCYSFLDHLESTEKFYAEALRILRPGGSFYFGLSPNREFYDSLRASLEFDLSDFLKDRIDISIEFKKAFEDGEYYAENFGINKHDLSLCEPGKSISKGLSPSEEKIKIAGLGASHININYEWIVQQNLLEQDTIQTIVSFLPFTSSCFKYFDLTGQK